MAKTLAARLADCVILGFDRLLVCRSVDTVAFTDAAELVVEQV